MKKGTSPVTIMSDLADNLRAALAWIKLAQTEGQPDLFRAAMPDAEAALMSFDLYTNLAADADTLQRQFERAIYACLDSVGDTLMEVRRPTWRHLADLRHAIEAIEKKAFERT